MIQWISDWLREIILVILLAVFVDLLLPSNTMHRYVKVILSLFILMTIISPIVSLFKADLNFDGWQEGTADVGAYQSLDQVLETGGKIKATNEQYSLQLIEARLAEQMTQDLELALPGQIHSVAVTAAIEENKVEIEKVRVDLYPNAMQSEENNELGESLSRNGLVYIEPIQSVVINIQIDHINEEHVLSSKGDQADPNKKERNLQISRILEQNWHVSPKQLVINYVEEVSGLFDQGVNLWESSYRSWSNG